MAEPGVVQLFPLDAEDRRCGVPKYISLASLARRLDVSRSWILQWHRTGILRGNLLQGRPGTRGVIIFPVEAVVNFLESRGIPISGREPLRGANGAGGGERA